MIFRSYRNQRASLLADRPEGKTLVDKLGQRIYQSFERWAD